MKRISVSFYDEVFEILEARSVKSGSNSIAHEIRELVNLGLQVEEAAQKNDGNIVDETTLKLIDMMKNNLVWSLETRLLARYVVEHLPESEHKNQVAVLESYKEKAASYVEGMLNDDIR